MLPITKPHPLKLIRQQAILLCAAALLCLLLVASDASAATGCRSLPGRSGLDQYCESIPGPTGDRGAGTGSGTGRHLSPSTAHALNNAGPAGKALLDLTGGPSSNTGSTSGHAGKSSSSGKGASSNGASGKGASGKSGGKVGDEPSNNVLSAVRSAADNGSTIGPAFVWILAALALLLAGVAWVRYRVRGRRAE